MSTKPDKNTAFVPFTPKMALELAAPQTWPAALMPCFVALCLAISTGCTTSAITCFALLAIVVLMQASVNTFNDYFDFIKGADTAENQLDTTDAVLVYNNVNPKSVKYYAICLLVLAFALGTYIIYLSGIIPLICGILGALVIVCYSGGRTPISYLPLGEIASGFTMGSVILFACYYSLTNNLDFKVIIYSFPLLIGIALILLTNNTCDIEKDLVAKRKTFSIVVGRAKAKQCYLVALSVMTISLLLIIAVKFRAGLIFFPFMLLAALPYLKAIWTNPLILETRLPAMTQILTINVIYGVFYGAMILLGN